MKGFGFFMIITVLCGFTMSAGASEARKISFSFNGKGYVYNLINQASGEFIIKLINKKNSKVYSLRVDDINKRASRAELSEVSGTTPVALYKGSIQFCGENVWIRWNSGPSGVKHKELNAGSYLACQKEKQSSRLAERVPPGTRFFVFCVVYKTGNRSLHLQYRLSIFSKKIASQPFRFPWTKSLKPIKKMGFSNSVTLRGIEPRLPP